MKTLVACTLFTVAVVPFAISSPTLASSDAHEAAVEQAIEATAPRVVQLRYFGDAGQPGEALGAAAAPVTGYALGESWVVTSTYALGERPAAIVCRFADGTQQQARVAARDLSRRVALLRLPGAAGSPPPALEGRPARVGETTIALGRVYSADSVNVSIGVVSAVDRLGGRALQTDALASPVNYGGPLIGLDGALLGILTPLAPPGQSGVGLYDSGVGFAVPAAVLSARLAGLADGHDVQPGWLGVALPKDDPLRAEARLTSVLEEGPAATAGLLEGDTIVSLAETPTPTVWRLKAVAAGLDAGQTVDVSVVRGDESPKPTTFRLTLGEQPPEPTGQELPVEALQTEQPGGP